MPTTEPTEHGTGNVPMFKHSKTTGPWHSEQCLLKAHPIFSLTKWGTLSTLLVCTEKHYARDHTINIIILLDPSTCFVMKDFPVATSVFLSSLSCIHLLKIFWVVLAKCAQSSAINWSWVRMADLLSFMFWARSCAKTLEALLIPKGHTCAWATQRAYL